MKKFVFIFLLLAFVCAAFNFRGVTTAQTFESRMPSPNLVISQFYGGGGLANDFYKNYYV